MKIGKGNFGIFSKARMKIGKGNFGVFSKARVKIGKGNFGIIFLLSYSFTLLFRPLFILLTKNEQDKDVLN